MTSTPAALRYELAAVQRVSEVVLHQAELSAAWDLGVREWLAAAALVEAASLRGLGWLYAQPSDDAPLESALGGLFASLSLALSALSTAIGRRLDNEPGIEDAITDFDVSMDVAEEALTYLRRRLPVP